jgi:hypothetical protein
MDIQMKAEASKIMIKCIKKYLEKTTDLNNRMSIWEQESLSKRLKSNRMLLDESVNLTISFLEDTIHKKWVYESVAYTSRPELARLFGQWMKDMRMPASLLKPNH